MDNKRRQQVMDSLTKAQRQGIAEIIRSADIEGDYSEVDESGGSVWVESASETLLRLAWYFDQYDSCSVLE